MSDLNDDNATKGQDAALSNTIRGLLLAVLVPLGARYQIDDAVIQALVAALGAISGAVLVWIGRQNARTPITRVAGVELPGIMLPKPEVPTIEEMKQ